MYNVSAAFQTAAKSNTRKILPKAVFNDTTELDGANIIEMTVTEAVNASGGISMGATISSKLEMKVKTPAAILSLNGGWVNPSVTFDGAYPGDNFDVEAGGTLGGDAITTADGTLIYDPLPVLGGNVLAAGGIVNDLEYCPLGKFYIADAESDNNFETTFKIVAYDAFSKTEDAYSPTITLPNTAAAILADIASQCGFSISSSIEYPTGEFNFYDFTCRQYIGYFAGLLGKNARFDRNGDLTFVWYENHEQLISRDSQHLGGLKRLSKESCAVQSISSGTTDNVLVAGDGTGISFENPFITQEILDNIFEKVGVFSYTPAQVKWRGNPAIEAGDIVSVEDKGGVRYTVYIMEQTIRIGGGMYSEIKCYRQSEAEINFSTSPTQKKLQQVYNQLQQAIQAATALMSGANGGIFEIIDEDGDGANDGWIIHSIDGQRFIKANLNGIGITTNGGATFTEALTAHGLNASAITTGQMSAQRVIVGDEALGNVFSVGQGDDGRIAVTIGAAGSSIRQRQTNDAVTFIDNEETPVAKFSTTGAEWQSMQQMKYCGFVWTKSAISGNVRFTKAEE